MQTTPIGRGLFYPSDNYGQPVFPEGHTLQARYVSHQALSTVDPMKVERLKWSREEAALSLQCFSVEEARLMLLDQGRVYLSGSAKSLISFQPANSAMTEAFRKNLGGHDKPGTLALALDNGTRLPGDLVRAQAPGICTLSWPANCGACVAGLRTHGACRRRYSRGRVLIALRSGRCLTLPMPAH
jgi:hypothetical protein